jgi:hypothetical protein
MARAAGLAEAFGFRPVALGAMADTTTPDTAPGKGTRPHQTDALFSRWKDTT